MRKIILCVLVALVYTWPASAQTFRGAVEPTVKSVRAKYPAQVMADQVGDMLNEIAWTHRPNLKLLKKGGGGKCPAPQGNGVTISCDILIWAPPGIAVEQTVHVDVFSGASGDGLVSAGTYWKAHGPCTKRPDSGCEMKNALDPIAPAGPIEPDSGNGGTPPTPSSDLATVLEQLADLRLKVVEVNGRFDIYSLRDVMNTLSEIAVKQTETQRQIDAFSEQLRTMTFPCFTANSKVLGAITLCPQGTK